MIKASELRIGNFVEYEVTTHVIEELHSDKVLHQWLQGAGAGYVTSYNSISGIELTPEWLERFGFDLVTVGDNPFDNPKMPYWVNEGVCLFFNEGEHNKGNYLVGVGDHRFAKYTAVTNRWISTVHTLQNVFHSWTGRELELKK